MLCTLENKIRESTIMLMALLRLFEGTVVHKLNANIMLSVYAKV